MWEGGSPTLKDTHPTLTLTLHRNITIVALYFVHWLNECGFFKQEGAGEILSTPLLIINDYLILI